MATKKKVLKKVIKKTIRAVGSIGKGLSKKEKEAFKKRALKRKEVISETRFKKKRNAIRGIKKIVKRIRKK